MRIVIWLKDGVMCLVGCAGIVTTAAVSLGMSDECRRRFWDAVYKSIEDSLRKDGIDPLPHDSLVTYSEHNKETALRTILNSHINENGEPVDGYTCINSEETVSTALRALGEKGDVL